MDTLAFPRVPSDGWRGGQCLALTCRHLDDLTAGEQPRGAQLLREHRKPQLFLGNRRGSQDQFVEFHTLSIQLQIDMLVNAYYICPMKTFLILLLTVTATCAVAQRGRSGQAPNDEPLQFRFVAPAAGNRVAAIAGIPRHPSTSNADAPSAGCFKSTAVRP